MTESLISERVVFGDASAPFRAQYVSQENARIYQREFPYASTTVCKSTYMDDSLDSVRDNQMAIQLFKELQGLWAKAGMKANKWLSNTPEVLTNIPQELRAYEINLTYCKDPWRFMASPARRFDFSS